MNSRTVNELPDHLGSNVKHAAEPKRSLEMGAVLEDLDVSTGRLLDAVAELHSRLTPILSAAPDASACSQPRRAYSCVMADALDNKCHRVDEATRRIHHILELLEI